MTELGNHCGHGLHYASWLGWRGSSSTSLPATMIVGSRLCQDPQAKPEDGTGQGSGPTYRTYLKQSALNVASAKRP